MQSISKLCLKAKMLEYFKIIEETKEPLIVTDHNKPVLKIIPYLEPKLPSEVFAEFQGKVKYYESITEPTGLEWAEINI